MLQISHTQSTFAVTPSALCHGWSLLIVATGEQCAQEAIQLMLPLSLDRCSRRREWIEVGHDRHDNERKAVAVQN
jgi:hypothetical protein